MNLKTRYISVKKPSSPLDITCFFFVPGFSATVAFRIVLFNVINNDSDSYRKYQSGFAGGAGKWNKKQLFKGFNMILVANQPQTRPPGSQIKIE